MSAEASAYLDAVRHDPCAYCAGDCGDALIHLDHIQARARGGSNDWSNLTAACAYCNVSKRDLTLLAFLGRAAHWEVWHSMESDADLAPYVFPRDEGLSYQRRMRRRVERWKRAWWNVGR